MLTYDAVKSVASGFWKKASLGEVFLEGDVCENYINIGHEFSELVCYVIILSRRIDIFDLSLLVVSLHCWSRRMSSSNNN